MLMYNIIVDISNTYITRAHAHKKLFLNLYVVLSDMEGTKSKG